MTSCDKTTGESGWSAETFLEPLACLLPPRVACSAVLRCSLGICISEVGFRVGAEAWEVGRVREQRSGGPLGSSRMRQGLAGGSLVKTL